MIDDTNQDGGDTENTGEGSTITVDVAELQKQLGKLNETVGSLKRENKDYKKKLEEIETVKATPQKTAESKELDWGQKAFLKASGLENNEEMELARSFAERTGEQLDAILADDVFKARLDKLRTTKANEAAADGASNKGTGSAGGKNTPEYWLNKLGANEPVPADLPRELREKIVKARMAKGKNGKVFYND